MRTIEEPTMLILLTLAAAYAAGVAIAERLRRSLAQMPRTNEDFVWL